MKSLFHYLSITKDHPQPIAFLFVKLFGVNFSRKFFSIKRNGYKLNLAEDDVSMSLFHKGKNTYKSIEILLQKLLQKGNNFIDIGGSVGLHSIYAKLIVENGTVIMVEPMPNLVQTALDNFSLNKTVIKLIPAAINNDSTSIEMANLEGRSFIKLDDLEDNNLLNPTIVGDRKFNNDFNEKLKIDACTLDSITENIDKIRLIKIDTEGAELFAVKSGINTLKKTDALLVGLFNPYTTSRYNYKAIDIVNFLVSNGFDNIFRVNELGLSSVDLINERFETADYYIFIKKGLINDLGLVKNWLN